LRDRVDSQSHCGLICSGVLIAILDAIMYRLVDLGPGVLVEADDLQSRMILAESAADRVADVHDIKD